MRLFPSVDRPFPWATALALAALSLLPPALSGCGQGAGLPKEISTQAVQAGVPEVFKNASPEAKKLAGEIAEAIQKQDFTSAWDKLHTLAQLPGLTDPQKEFVASSTAAVGAEVNKAEASGNEAAKQAIEFHRANK